MPQTKRPPDYAIIKRREEEQRRAVLQDDARYRQRVGQIALWETSTQKTIEKNQALRRYQELKDQAASQLSNRRRQLAQLLSSEQQMYEVEVANRFVHDMFIA